jgi:hypothetical protein
MSNMGLTEGLVVLARATLGLIGLTYRQFDHFSVKQGPPQGHMGPH